MINYKGIFFYNTKIDLNYSLQTMSNLLFQLRVTQVLTLAGFVGIGYSFHTMAEKHHSAFRDLYEAAKEEKGGGGFSAPCGSIPSPSPSPTPNKIDLPPIRGI